MQPMSGPTQFILTWEAPDSTNNAELIGFNVYRNDSLLITLDPTTFTYNETLNYWPGFAEMCYAVSAVYINPAGESNITEIQCFGWLTGENEMVPGLFNFYAIPIPFDNQVTFHFKLFENESAEITILDITGKPLQRYSIETQADRLRISTDNLKPGIYFYQLKTASGVTDTKKMIKL